MWDSEFYGFNCASRFFASKHGLSGFTTKLSHQLSEENIRVTGLYPPDFELTGLDTFVDSQSRMGERLLNGRSVWETIRFVLAQPRSCHIGSIYFQGPTREKLGSGAEFDDVEQRAQRPLLT